MLPVNFCTAVNWVTVRSSERGPKVKRGGPGGVLRSLSVGPTRPRLEPAKMAEFESELYSQDLSFLTERLYEDQFVDDEANDFGYSSAYATDPMAKPVAGLQAQEDEALLSEAFPQVNSDVYRENRWGSSKRRILTIVSLCAFVAPFANPLFLPGLGAIQAEFNASSTAIAFASSIYSLPLGVLPLVWGPASDVWGRRRFFLFNFSLMIAIFYFGTLSWSIYIVILFRFLEAIPISSIQVLAYGVISDIYPRKDRGKATVRLTSAKFWPARLVTDDCRAP